MNIFKKSLGMFFTEFIYGGHLTALEASSMLFTLYILKDISANFTFLVFPYLMAQIVYLYNHIREVDFDAESNPERSMLIKKRMKAKLLLFISYSVLLLVLLLQTNSRILIFALIIVILGLLYTEYFKKVKITGFKNFYITVITVSVLFFPVLNNDLDIDAFFLIVLFIYFLTNLTNTIFFDVKDVESDAQRGIKTLPVVLGLNNTLNLLYTFKLISFVSVVVGVYLKVLPQKFLLYIIAITYSLIYLNRGFKLRSKKLRLVSYLVADAEFSFWLLVLVLGKSFT